ncbi:MAG: S9 family peptidase, partial [Rhodothermales bacterium]|nr:S9 family peptidase [Rhodothermales bacterium]
AYLDQVMSHTKDLQQTIFDEIKGRIKQDDSTVPYRTGDHYYYVRYVDGKEYPIYCRKPGSLDAAEQVILDVNVLAEGKGYFQVGQTAPTEDQNILAFAADTVGRRFYTLRFKDLTTGETLEDAIPDVTGNIAWANDSRTIFYSKQDPETLRWHRIFRHKLGTDPSQDVLVYEELDETFSSFVFKSRSKRYILIGSSQTLSDEYRFVDADQPEGSFTVIQPRERDLEYSVGHLGDYFYIRTNLDAENFRLMRAPISNPSKDHWEEVIAHRQSVYLADFDLFDDFLVLSERKDGLMNLRAMRWDGTDDHYLNFGESAYLAYVSTNPETDSKILRYGYMSMTTPNSVYDYDMVSRKKVLKKRDEVLGGFESSDYVTARIYARARDGVAVPISLVHHTGTPIDGTAPVLLYGYGSYGASMDPYFSASRLSLLDRGFVYAIAHIRGGQELGRQWYEDGKLLKKKNTFTDFIDCADYLVTARYADPNRVYAMGGSAGGLLMGAVANMRPDRFHGIVAQVPFVDVVTTMLDDTIPLTTSEYDEWGNPNEKEYYDYILSYSPYDNVEAKDYPNILVTTGLHDSQVQYWEPAKWVARLRAKKTDSNRLIMKTNMEAGHGGASGRYRIYREIALDFAFILDLAGSPEIVSPEG